MEDDAKVRVKLFNGKHDDDLMLSSLRVVLYLECRYLAKYAVREFEMETPKENASAVV